jgi:hypothetical protein
MQNTDTNYTKDPNQNKHSKRQEIQAGVDLTHKNEWLSYRTPTQSG